MAQDREDRQRIGATPVWMSMPLEETERLSERLLDCRGTQSAAALRELIWLRAILIEQQRRTPAIERARFGRRADNLLATLAEALEVSHSVRSHD